MVHELDLVDLAIAAHQDRHDVLAVGMRHLVEDRLDHPLEGERREELAQGLARGGARRLLLVHGDLLRRRGRRRCTGRGFLDVRGVTLGAADGDGVLARVRVDHELLAAAAPDGAGVRLHRGEAQAAAREDAAVDLAHALVGRAHALGVEVEGIGVLHDELASTHEPEAGTDLVAELRLDLVHDEGELLVRSHVALDPRRDHLFVRRTEAHVGALAVGEVEEDALADVAVPAAALLPELARLQGGHQELDAAGPGRAPRERWTRSCAGRVASAVRRRTRPRPSGARSRRAS